LLIHARNDPWIPANAYFAFDWDSNPRLTPLLPKGGGPFGFHASAAGALARPLHRNFLDGLTAARAGRR